MSRREESFGYWLVHECSWWVSVLLGLLLYGFLQWGAPLLVSSEPSRQAMNMLLTGVSKVPWVSFMIFGPLAALSLLRSGVESIAATRRKSAAQAKGGSAGPVMNAGAASASPACPQCGEPMVQRTARKGANAGQMFWGCAQYPQCRGTR